MALIIKTCLCGDIRNSNIPAKKFFGTTDYALHDILMWLQAGFPLELPNKLEYIALIMFRCKKIL